MMPAFHKRRVEKYGDITVQYTREKMQTWQPATEIDFAQAIQELINELSNFDCELKDPDIGLIDFLSLRDGREIYLCWYLGEERINYWHYLDTGFKGRQPL